VRNVTITHLIIYNYTRSKGEDRKYEIEQNITGCISESGLMSDNDDCDDNYLGRDTYLIVYSGVNLLAVSFCLFRALFFYMFCTRISIKLHNRMFQSLVRAPTKFFDDNPSGKILQHLSLISKLKHLLQSLNCVLGRVMNRFTKDLGAIDELLPPAFVEFITIFLNMLGAISVVIISNYFLSVPTVFLFIALFLMRRYFVQTARDLKRIEAMSMFAYYSHHM
jgi:ATP-binding cassette subfamily C (CFTR/MRP) protein 4